MQMDIRDITPGFAVSPQISKEDAEAIAASGFCKVINNRPDGEEDDQPSSMNIMNAVSNQGVGYLHIPISGSDISSRDIADFRNALQSAGGPVLAYCRSGMRSTKLWALYEVEKRSVYDVIQMAARAGYDLTGFADQLAQHAAEFNGASHENA